ncbi:MAG: hypothetical protein AAGF94_18685 [Pseudomonadota bacterium]
MGMEVGFWKEPEPPEDGVFVPSGAVLNAAVKMPNADAGEELVLELVSQEFRSGPGAAIPELVRSIADVKGQLQSVEQRLNSAELELDVCPPEVPSALGPDGTPCEVPFTKWRMKDQLGTVFLGGFLCTALSASLLSAHANLVGTGLEIFDGTLLPWCMAGLAPMSSLAIKTLASHQQSPMAKKVFTFFLLGFTVLSILVWIVWFPWKYNGLAGIDLGGLFDEPTWIDGFRDTGFIAVTLLTEVLVGSVLALRLAHIADLYSDNSTKPNPDHAMRSASVKSLTEDRDRLRDELLPLTKELEELEGQLGARRTAANLAYQSRRADAASPTL